MAVNTFVKDSQDPNPLIRALAVRTMGCIRVERITEYLCDPLMKCMRDDDPYVRKTAAICVAKLFDINPELVEDRGFLDGLKELLGDSNPMVVANAVASLMEISSRSPKAGVFAISPQVLFKLLSALNECTEWGQVFILDALASYNSRDSREAESIVERVAPRLSHANCAIVLSAVKVLMKQLDLITSPDMQASLCKKMAPPLVTLLSTEPEMQYVALRNIALIVQKRPEILQHEVKVFFCKYNDPTYVKMEKLEIMIALVNDRNVDQVLLELKEYATEVDVDFVRKAVRCIGRCAVMLERAAQKCIAVLLELISTKVNYVTQEAVVVIMYIFRRYPNRYESVIADLCDNLDTLDEPDAKAAMIWIIGEYASRIDNAEELLESFLETFPEEPPNVQLQLLTATVKLFLKKPTEGPQNMIQLVLSNATQETDNPDLRDRAFVYWRLLSTDPEAAKEVVLAEKPVISDDARSIEASLLNELLSNMGTLASVYHKPPESFVSRARYPVSSGTGPVAVDYGAMSGPESSSGGLVGDLLGGDVTPATAPAGNAAPPTDLMGDLMGLDVGAPAAVAAAPPMATPSGADMLGDLLGGGAPAAPAAPAAPVDPFDLLGGGGAPVGGAAGGAPPPALPLPVLLPAARGNGMEISGAVKSLNGQVVYELSVSNQGAQPIDGMMIQLNKSFFGLAPTSPAVTLTPSPVPPGGVARGSVPLAINSAMVVPPGTAPSVSLQVAVKHNGSAGQVYYFTDSLSLDALFAADGRLEKNAFLDLWRGIPDSQEQSTRVQAVIPTGDALIAKLEARSVFFLARRPADNGMEAFYFCGKLISHHGYVLLELSLREGVPGIKVCVRSQASEVSPLALQCMEKLLLA